MNDILEVIGNGLTYGGNLLHSLINYGLIAITIAPFLVPAQHQQARAAQRWVGCLLIALAVQVILWFAVGAVGVSVIWCTMAGYSLLELRANDRARGPRRTLLAIALASALAGILYYAFTFPVITTVAHAVAVVMGIGIFYLLRTIMSGASAERTA